ncbi:MAG TPA: hypothetical protein VLE71_05240 [Actinomycetota bacterium]|nr:hypothetical protein [Actinomycetota bacterium]
MSGITSGSRTERNPQPEHGRGFWVATAVGWTLIAFGLWTVLRRSGATKPANFAAWFVGVALVHDLVLAPVIAGIAVVLGPRIPARLRTVVTGGLVVSGALVLVSLPPILGDRPPDNPSLLPRDYGVGLLVALVAVWTSVAIVATAVLGRSRRGRPDDEDPR